MIVVKAGTELLAASDGDIAVHADGQWFSRSAGTLHRVGPGAQVSGTHAGLGPWVGWQTTWQCPATRLITTVKSFTLAGDAFVFEQRFPDGARNTSLLPPGSGGSTKDWAIPITQALSQWPSFTARSMRWKAQGWSGTMSCGTTIADSVPALGAEYLSLRGGPVLAFSEPDGFIENCTGAVFSTFDNFKSGVWARQSDSDDQVRGPGTCTVAKDVDYERSDIFGSDYSRAGLGLYNTTTDLSGAECCGWCQGYANCTAWTICAGCPEPYTDICFLKDSTKGRTRSAGAISGTVPGRQPPGPAPEPSAPALVAGVHGGIASLPANHTTSFVIVAPRRKCRVETMRRWGAVMQQAYGTNHRDHHARGPATSKLGFWTDNGAFYDWYHWTVPEIVAGKGPGGQIPSATLVAVQRAIAARGVPVRYYQLDAFWYYAQGPNWLLCAKDWVPEPQLFPQGLRNLSAAMASPLEPGGMGMLLYIPEVCSTNVYKDFSFLKSFPDAPNTGPIALVAPAQAERFYGQLFDWGLANGAMAGFEIDFMDWQLLQFPELLQTVGLAEEWQVGIGAAAAARNLSVQLCMEVPAELMTTLLSPAITNARGSGDGGADMAGFAASSLLMAALGIAPFTDNFYSGRGASSSARAALAILSRGPVGFGDEVGKFNATLLNRTCTADGTLLQPSETAVQLDGPGYCASGCSSLVTSTVSRIRGGGGGGGGGANASAPTTYGILMAFSAAADQPFPSRRVRRAELTQLPTNAAYVYWVLDDPNCTAGARMAECVHTIDATHPLELVDAAANGLAIVLIAPVVSNQGWVLLGEAAKLVPVSEDRIVSVSPAPGSGLSVAVVGAVGETVALLGGRLGGAIGSFAATVGPGGVATILVQ